MDHRQSLETFQIEIPRAQAFRLLGVRPRRRQPRESVLAMFEEEYARAAELVDARAVMRLSHGGLPGSGYIDPAMPLVAVVCTIGGALERKVSELADGGEAARAVILDALGSAAAEEAADRSNMLICRMAAPTDFAPDCRRSPGYGKWDIREQRVVFRFLDAGAIGVTLSESCMMIPRKSISYVVPLEGGKPGGMSGHRCARCGMAECPYRDQEDEDKTV